MVVHGSSGGLAGQAGRGLSVGPEADDGADAGSLQGAGLRVQQLTGVVPQIVMATAMHPVVGLVGGLAVRQGLLDGLLGDRIVGIHHCVHQGNHCRVGLVVIAIVETISINGIRIVLIDALHHQVQLNEKCC